MGFLSLLGNRNIWIAIAIAVLVGGVWLKIHSLQGDVAEAKEELAAQVEKNRALEDNNKVLHQNLDMALSINDANAKLLDQIKVDQENAALALKRLATDLSSSKATISQARARLAATTLPAIPVPQRIVDAVISIQDSRTTQAAVNKRVEEELK